MVSSQKKLAAQDKAIPDATMFSLATIKQAKKIAKSAVEDNESSTANALSSTDVKKYFAHFFKSSMADEKKAVAFVLSTTAYIKSSVEDEKSSTDDAAKSIEDSLSAVANFSISIIN